MKTVCWACAFFATLAANAAEFPLELRGVVRTAERPLVGVTDPVSGAAVWLARGEQAAGWTFAGLDASASRALFSKDGETVSVELEAGGFGGSAAGASAATPPRIPAWFSNVEAVIVTEGAHLLENPADDAAWQAFAARNNLIVQRGLPGPNGERSFAFLPCRPGESPQARPAPDRATLPPEGIGLTGGAWMLVQATPQAEGRFEYAYSKMGTPNSYRPSPVQLPPMHPNEDPKAYIARLNALREREEEAQLLRDLQAGRDP